MLNNGFLMLIVYSLATWRISSLLVNELGPFAIFLRFRVFIGIEYIIMGEPEQTVDDVINNYSFWENEDELYQKEYANEFAKALSCIWCTSVWVSLFFILCEATLISYALGTIHAFALWMAVSALAIKIGEI